MGAEQEAAFRSRGDQSDPDAEPGDAERSDRESCRVARWKTKPEWPRTFATPAASSGIVAARNEIEDRAVPRKRPRATRRNRRTKTPAMPSRRRIVDEALAKARRKDPPHARLLIKAWIESARRRSAPKAAFLLGFRRSKNRDGNAGDAEQPRFLEALLKEISGRDWNVKFSVKETDSRSSRRRRNRAAAEKPADCSDFQGRSADPGSLEIFKGEIKTVND